MDEEYLVSEEVWDYKSPEPQLKEAVLESGAKVQIPNKAYLDEVMKRLDPNNQPDETLKRIENILAKGPQNE